MLRRIRTRIIVASVLLVGMLAASPVAALAANSGGHGP
jgi:Spy/CpxP family protein refolding chaperone